jgi:hypothetical protein
MPGMLTTSRGATALLLALVLAGCAGPSSSAAPTSPASTLPPAASASPEPSGSPSTTTSASPDPSPAAPSPTSVAVAWRELDAGATPTAREDQTWTVDPAARVAYLFGGRDGAEVHGDLWAYDLATDTWQQLESATAGPDARFGHEAVWVDGTGLVVWAGQAGPTTFFGDLWAYDPGTSTWSALPNGGDRPLARYGSCAAIGPDGRLWISHGFTEDGTRFADTRAYDFETGSWSDETPAGRAPVNRCLHGCWWTDGGELALYAGQTTGVQALGDLWRMTGANTGDVTWERVEGTLPDDRNLYAFTHHGESVVVFGGRGLGDAYHRDVYAVDATTLAFEALQPEGARPPARSGATLIDDPAGGRVLLFGGRNGRGAFSDTWELTLP